MKNLIIYVHGKDGSAQEAEHYKTLFPSHEVIGLYYRSKTPWEAKKEFPAFFTEQRSRYDHITLVANSIGAYFAMTSLHGENIKEVFSFLPWSIWKNSSAI